MSIPAGRPATAPNSPSSAAPHRSPIAAHRSRRWLRASRALSGRQARSSPSAIRSRAGAPSIFAATAARSRLSAASGRNDRDRLTASPSRATASRAEGSVGSSETAENSRAAAARSPVVSWATACASRRGASARARLRELAAGGDERVPGERDPVGDDAERRVQPALHHPQLVGGQRPARSPSPPGCRPAGTPRAPPRARRRPRAGARARARPTGRCPGSTGAARRSTSPGRSASSPPPTASTRCAASQSCARHDERSAASKSPSRSASCAPRWCSSRARAPPSRPTSTSSRCARITSWQRYTVLSRVGDGAQQPEPVGPLEQRGGVRAAEQLVAARRGERGQHGGPDEEVPQRRRHLVEHVPRQVVARQLAAPDAQQPCAARRRPPVRRQVEELEPGGPAPGPVREVGHLVRAQPGAVTGPEQLLDLPRPEPQVLGAQHGRGPGEVPRHRGRRRGPRAQGDAQVHRLVQEQLLHDAGRRAPVDRLQLVEDEQRRRDEHLSRAPPGRPRSSSTAPVSATAGARSAHASWRCARTAAVLLRAPSSVSHATGAVSRAATCERNVVLPQPAAATTLTRGCAPGPTTGSSSRSRDSPRGAGRRVRDRRTVGCPSAPDTAPCSTSSLCPRKTVAYADPSRRAIHPKGCKSDVECVGGEVVRSRNLGAGPPTRPTLLWTIELADLLAPADVEFQAGPTTPIREPRAPPRAG